MFEVEMSHLQGKDPVSVALDLRMPQFKIELVEANRCNNRINVGNYSCLVAQFHLKRSISFHLIQNYLPSILIVAVSWVSFWMDIESVPGRISLGVITLLAVSQLATGTSLPQTSYVKVSPSPYTTYIMLYTVYTLYSYCILLHCKL